MLELPDSWLCFRGGECFGPDLSFTSQRKLFTNLFTLALLCQSELLREARGAVRKCEGDLRGLRMSVPFFRMGEYKVWGATAMILSEFVERLRAVV